MSNFNFTSKNPNENLASPIAIQGPTMIDLAANQKAIKVVEKKNEVRLAPKESAATVSFGRKKRNASQQTPAEIVSEASQKAYTPSELIQCQIKINDESQQYLETPFARQVNLAPEELEELLLFVEGVEQKRKKQEKEQQEKRSWQIAQKIFGQQGGAQFLEENNLVFANNAETSIQEWYQSLTIMKADQEQEEVSQPLNFFNPQHSWILENWLSQQAVSWTVRRYNQNNDQIVYQVSYGFPDQTFLDAEGPSREGAIMAVAEDLME
ncbi:MAG: hypothetical protein SFU25_03625 [Candidatus Caenarcaniphilales bacterium]|nr:hypothetical protein [Candidatus Caenarcaniphilales bacterium]